MTLTSDGLTSIDRRGNPMPFIIRKNDAGEFCVFSQSADGEPVGKSHGCHPTEEAARMQQKALYANVPDAKKADIMALFGPAAVKALGDGRVGGYLVQWGSEATKDADQEWFTPETDFETDFPARCSVRYHHGLDPSIGRARLCYGKMDRTDQGVYVEATLDISDPKQAVIYRKAEAGELGWSSGAVQHATLPPRERPGGPIQCWPGIAHDASLTPIPSDRRNAAVALKCAPVPPVGEPLVVCECGGVKSQSLAEVTERWIESGETLIGDYRTHAMKAGRKLSAARRERLSQMRSMIDDMLSETEPRDAEASAPPVTGEGATETAESAATLAAPLLPSFDDLYAGAVRVGL